MRFFWKALLIIIPLGSYWLYQKGSPSADTEDQPQSQQAESPASKGAEAKQDTADQKRQADPPANKKENDNEASPEQAIERLTQIDGVTSRVAENLVQKGIYSKEALTALSRNELMDIKGIGPKRTEKILGM